MLRFLLMLWCAQAWAQSADIVLRGGPVYTVDAARSWASAVAVLGNRIAYVGDEEGVKPWIGKQTKIIELAGRLLLPGFQDSHIHPGGALSLSKIRLHGVMDRGEIEKRIRKYVRENPGLPWIEGRGWEVAAFKPEGRPHRGMLDALVQDKPAYLSASDGHTAWVNSRALKLAAITAETPDPPNGHIEREPGSLEPTGVLHDSAMGLVGKLLPPSTREDRVKAYRLIMKELNAVGVTAIIDAATGLEHESVWGELGRNNELTLRVTLCQEFDPEADTEEKALDSFKKRREALGSGNPRATAVKLVLDGIIEQHTGALLAPYLDKPGDRGPLYMKPERLKKFAARLDKEGFQVHVHAIGDRAVREALDAFEAARKANGPRDSRHHLAHVELIAPADIPRLRRLGVAANMTPVWARGDELNLVFTEPRLGPERSRWLYPHKSILDAGGRLAWGTDWPVTTFVPMEGLETAVSRRHLGGRKPTGALDTAWLPEERLSIEEALAAYTISGAYLSFEEKDRGSIEAGKLADLTILSENLFELPETEIHDVPVDLTLFDGKIVYQRDLSKRK
ncbi:MAG: amidohydrolase [Elusimicrobia bacterium]|nr:amidohydrolase [Elusimicrobiota bacterium]